jgi:hypothetical protein
MKVQYFLLSILAMMMSAEGYAQKDTTSWSYKIGHGVYHLWHRETYGKNVIRYNPTPAIFFVETKNGALGYERVLWHNQSISANLGYFVIPDFIGNSIGVVDVRRTKNTGVIFSMDYRFYLKSLNTRPAPNGIYIGPFYSYYGHSGARDFSYDDGTTVYQASLSNSFAMHNIGFQLGYQFIFFKRLTLDMILFGPAISFYKFDLSLESNLSDTKAKEIYEKYYDSFFSQYPVFDQLVRFGDFSKKGHNTGIMPNFRYLFQIGYSF